MYFGEFGFFVPTSCPQVSSSQINLRCAAKNIHRGSRNAPEMIGADVDEVVDAKVAQVLAVGSKLFGCDPVVVGVGEAPGFVEGTGGLIEPVAAGLEAVDGLVVDLVGIDAGFSLPLLAGGGNFIVAEGDIVVGTVSDA